MLIHPKAFISHASEDKDRFVLDFARRLRATGIDAWLDRWEINAGDSLVDKIFEEGIKDAQAFIVVLSSNSVSKNWVREELNVGVVHKIDKKCRLIPVIIDDCDVPQSLRHLKWVRIGNLDDYDLELAEISNSIFGRSEKPPLGSPPTHFTSTVVDYFPDLTKTDNLVFNVLCHNYLKKNTMFFSISDVTESFQTLGLDEAQISESLEILSGRHYLNAKTTAGGKIWGINLNVSSLDIFLRAEIEGYGQQLETVVSKIVNESVNSSETLQETTGFALPIIMHILRFLERNGWIKTVGPAGFPSLKIIKVSVELKRKLQQA